MQIEFTVAEKARLVEIDQELDEIEQTPFDQASQALKRRHDELCRERWRIDPPSALDVLGVV
ncbi:hypothetical protein KXR64_16560 [Brucella intermedia]|uniref:hypothetical protein n=1 Tax=Brucella TaxID=234 RepID=UPI0009464F6C|nr:hypothetical protein [Brucella intermedia]